jgi:8-oxo-dGTP pyrophosphatase MutT (NUDIX family)
LTEDLRIETVGVVECRLIEWAWSFADESAGEIADHWRRRVAANPSLFDGAVLLANRVERRNDTLEIDCFRTSFSRFLAWRDFGFPDRRVFNVFAMPALRSADGAFLLGEMGPGHSLAGSRFFPGGTPDLDDVKDGRVDLFGSLVRELAEETGLTLDNAHIEPGWRIVYDGRRVACLKLIDSPATASELAAAAALHIASEEEPELARVHFVSRLEELRDTQIPVFTRSFLCRLLNK